MKRHLSSEYVGIGHPDKVADQISDTILDMYLSKDPKSRVAAETLVSGNKVIVAGEITSSANYSEDEIKSHITDTVVKAGYNKDVPCQFREGNLDISIFLKPQSPNIHDGVDKSDGDIGAGDQGIMFGFATSEMGEGFYLPTPYVIAADILSNLNYKITIGRLPGIYTDNKSQVCCFYQNGNIWIDKIILSSFHNKRISVDEVRQLLQKEVIDEILYIYRRNIPKDKDIEIFINSAGPFWVGGPEADAGLTGRKIIVDTYGGFAPHGGGAFSGKDPSKVDRSAAYMARHVAKSLVVNGYSEEVLVQLSYAIGQVHPFSISVKSDSNLPEEYLVKLVEENFDLSPKGIIDYLQLTDSNVVKYRSIASGGHFLSLNVPWEKTKAF
jgi:S-adenosylmethionine synthetase